MEAELPYMLNSLMFGKHLQRYSAADIRAMLARLSVASYLNDLVSKGNKVYFECISKDLEGNATVLIMIEFDHTTFLVLAHPAVAAMLDC